MADVIKEYAIQIQVQGSKAVIKEFKELEKVEKKQNKELKQTNSLLWTYAKRLVGIYAIYKMFKKGLNLGINFAEQGNSLKMMSSMANVSAQSLQKWGNALRRFNGDSKNVASIMGSLNQKIYNRRYFNQNEFADLIRDYGAGEYLQATDAEQFLIGLAKKMEGYSDVNAKNDIAFKAGVTDPAMIEFLKQGSQAVIDQLKQSEALFSSKDLKDAEEAKKQLEKFNLQLEKLSIALGRMTLQPLTDLIKELTLFLQDPKKYIATALSDTEVKGKPTSMKVIKDMFNPKNMWQRFADYTATSGRAGYFKGVDEMSKALFGADYEKAMSLLEGVGGEFYDDYDRLTGNKTTQVTNNTNVTQYITGSNAEEIGNASAKKISEVSKANQNQSGVIQG